MIAEQSRKKSVRIIPPTVSQTATTETIYRQKRVAAYCRVSTKQEEQLNSYEVQCEHYTERIRSEPKWTLVGIFADKGISGTSTKNREGFNKLMALCKRGKVDMIITKSISRFARNTVDCLKYIRMLKELNVDVYFEEQGIHSLQSGAEFYITIYGSIAQSESENISANVKWGKSQSAREGNVTFQYRNFLGYRKGADGKPEIVEEEANIVRKIYERFLTGDSIRMIVDTLDKEGVATPSGKKGWCDGTIRSILTNEKYKGDAVLNKTYTVDCLTKKTKANNGERPKYYVSNNHPAIIDGETFGRVQEELARRSGKRKVKQVGTKTELGKYSGKYALTDLLICGECGTPYRRCTWTASGKKRIVWRCINRLDFGKKYCHESPTLAEEPLQKGIMEAIHRAATQNAAVMHQLKLHIGMGLQAEKKQDSSIELQIRIAEIDAEFQAMMNDISSETMELFDEARAEQLLSEKADLQKRLEEAEDTKETTESRLDDLYMILEGIQNRPISYDDRLVRQLLKCVIVEAKDRIRIVFANGEEVTQSI